MKNAVKDATEHAMEDGVEDAVETIQWKDLLLQSLEHEMGGVKIYESAVRCAVHPELQKEWRQYLEQTRRHVGILTDLCESLGFDPEEQSPGRPIVRSIGAALVEAIDAASRGGNPVAAQIVAAECVVLAETKDHLDWMLIGKCADELEGDIADTLSAAYEEIEDEEDEHLYHTSGWCRELWLKSLGLTATLPPPEEKLDVRTATEAEDAQNAENLGSRNSKAKRRTSTIVEGRPRAS